MKPAIRDKVPTFIADAASHRAEYLAGDDGWLAIDFSRAVLFEVVVVKFALIVCAPSNLAANNGISSDARRRVELRGFAHVILLAPSGAGYAGSLAINPNQLVCPLNIIVFGSFP